MFVFLTNLSFVLVTVVCVIVLSFISASDIMDDAWIRRLKDDLVTVGHVIDFPLMVDVDESSSVMHERSACTDAVTKLTNAVTEYTDCTSKHALNSSVCERCVDDYFTVAGLVATNFSVLM